MAIAAGRAAADDQPAGDPGTSRIDAGIDDCDRYSATARARLERGQRIVGGGPGGSPKLGIVETGRRRRRWGRWRGWRRRRRGGRDRRGRGGAPSIAATAATAERQGEETGRKREGDPSRIHQATDRQENRDATTIIAEIKLLVYYRLSRCRDQPPGSTISTRRIGASGEPAVSRPSSPSRRSWLLAMKVKRSPAIVPVVGRSKPGSPASSTR